jgi:antitoxin CptB
MSDVSPSRESEPSMSDLERRRLTWRLRRGMLENDIFLTQFMEKFGDSLSEADLLALDLLMDLPDDHLFKILIGEKPLEGELNQPVICALVEKITQSTT